MDKKLEWAIGKMIGRLYPNFFGSFVFTFQNGKLQHLRVEENIKPDEC